MFSISPELMFKISAVAAAILIPVMTLAWVYVRFFKREES